MNNIILLLTNNNELEELTFNMIIKKLSYEIIQEISK